MKPTAQLNKRITFRQATKTPDTSAGNTASYADWFTTWAAVEKMSGKRAFDHGYDALIDTFDVWVRYRSQLSTISKDTRVSWDGKDFGIKPGERVDNNGDVQTTGSIYHFVMTAETF